MSIEAVSEDYDTDYTVGGFSCSFSDPLKDTREGVIHISLSTIANTPKENGGKIDNKITIGYQANAGLIAFLIALLGGLIAPNKAN